MLAVVRMSVHSGNEVVPSGSECVAIGLVENEYVRPLSFDTAEKPQDQLTFSRGTKIAFPMFGLYISVIFEFCVLFRAIWPVTSPTSGLSLVTPEGSILNGGASSWKPEHVPLV